MASNIWQIKQSVSFILLAVVMVAFIAFVERKEKQYKAMEVYVQGISDVYFVDEAEVLKLLENEFPVLKTGNHLADISLNKIEGKVESHPLVKNAEVFKDLKGNIVVKIEQYRPVARIIRPMAAHGYISVEGVVLPTSPRYTTRVLTLEGALADELLGQEDLSKEYGDLMKLIHFIEQDEFWSAQIASLEINRKQEIKMYQQVGKQVIEFGRPIEIEEKFKKITLFYKEILPVKGWNTYDRVNVKYKDQIICE
ncbi:MAG: cell division protein [Anditalea sp.]